jgi:hypothetical protein
MISNLLKNKISIDNSKMTFMFSGRVAINILSKKFKKNRIVLIPKYICNVVDMAFEKEYKIIRYGVDEKFEPNIDELIYSINNNKVDILLLASLYGSGEFINELYDHKSKLYKAIKQKKLEVIIDFAQDFYRINSLTLEYKNYHYIFSFNDKSFMGSMGSIIVSNTDLSNIVYKQLSVAQNIFLLKNYLIKVVNCKIPLLLKAYQLLRGIKNKKIIKMEYEFSTCKVFPYTYDNYKISSIQLFFALIGIFRLKVYYKNKCKYLNIHKDFMQNRFVDTSAYIIVKGSDFQTNKFKPPYAYYNNQYDSLYPNLKIIHNKGFCDK